MAEQTPVPLPVLCEEIARDLSLNLVQIGVIWGASALLGIGMSLAGGSQSLPSVTAWGPGGC